VSDADICTLGASQLDGSSNLPRLQAVVPLTQADSTDAEQFGEIDNFQALGLTVLPFPANTDGHAEGIILRDVGNTDGVVVGGRDERCAGVYGNLKPGDTALHSTDPDASAQVQCKANRIVSAVTKDSQGETITVTLDGEGDNITIAGFGGVFQITRDNGMMLAQESGGKSCAIMMKDGVVSIIGIIVLGGAKPGPPLVVAGAVQLPSLGVFLGAP